MKYASKAILAGAACLCVSSLSFGWSDDGGLQLSVASAQARVGRPATPVSVAGATRRQARRGAYVGAGLAGATALGAAAAMGFNPYYSDVGYGYGGGPYQAYDAMPYGAYGFGYEGASCAPAPRTGAFATQPWTNMPTCMPY